MNYKRVSFKKELESKIIRCDYIVGLWVGCPTTWYIREDTKVPFPKNRLFAVYLNDRMYVYDFAAEYVDNEDLLSPKDWKNRFMGLIWKSTS